MALLAQKIALRHDGMQTRVGRIISCLVPSLIVGILLSCSSDVFAADHLDGPAASADPAADITDVYAWMQNGNSINLVMNLFPLANASSQFSDSVQYVFRIESQSGYGAVDERNTIICTFSAAQAVSCLLNGDAVISDVDASNTAGAINASGTFRIFTGLRNDPFFFDLKNFNVVRGAVRDAVPALQFDDAGCPTLDQATKDVLVSSLVGGGGLDGANEPPVDFFGSLNVLSIVIQADRSLFGSGPLYAVSGSTHRAP